MASLTWVCSWLGKRRSPICMTITSISSKIPPWKTVLAGIHRSLDSEANPSRCRAFSRSEVRVIYGQSQVVIWSPGVKSVKSSKKSITSRGSDLHFEVWTRRYNSPTGQQEGAGASGASEIRIRFDGFGGGFADVAFQVTRRCLALASKVGLPLATLPYWLPFWCAGLWDEGVKLKIIYRLEEDFGFNLSSSVMFSTPSEATIRSTIPSMSFVNNTGWVMSGDQY